MTQERNGWFHSCDLGTGGNEKHREWQENKKNPIPKFLEKIFLKFTRKNSRFHSQQGPEMEMEGKFGR